jgi:phosphoribosylanthranilate isomerase
MNKLRIKICGITSVKNMHEIAQTNPDMIGLIFVPTSPRVVSIETAGLISNIAKGYKIQTVGVFQDASPDVVNTICQCIPLDFVQLHGTESVAYCRSIRKNIIKTIVPTSSINPAQYKSVADIFLFDKSKSEDTPIDYDYVREFSKTNNTMIAGGLNKHNIKSIRQMAEPNLFGIDVNSGVEDSVGNKDVQLIKKLIQRMYEY